MSIIRIMRRNQEKDGILKKVYVDRKGRVYGEVPGKVDPKHFTVKWVKA